MLRGIRFTKQPIDLPLGRMSDISVPHTAFSIMPHDEDVGERLA